MNNLKDKIGNMKKSNRLLLSLLLLFFGIVVDIFLISTVHDFNLKSLLYYLYFVLPGIILGITSFIKLPKLISILSTIMLWLLIVGSIFMFFIASIDIYLQPVIDTKNYSYVFRELKTKGIYLNDCFPEVIPKSALKSEMYYSRQFVSRGLTFSLYLTFDEENFSSELSKIDNKYKMSRSENNRLTYIVPNNGSRSEFVNSLFISVDTEKKEIMYSYSLGF